MEELQGSGSKIKCNKIFEQRGTWNLNRRSLSQKSKSSQMNILDFKTPDFNKLQ